MVSAVGKVSLASRFENLMEAEASLRTSGSQSISTLSQEDGVESVVLDPNVDPQLAISADPPQDPSAQTDVPPSYTHLQEWLVLSTAGVGILITLTVALVYSPLTAGNYLLGVLGGVAYLRMLGRSVAQLGKTQGKLGMARFGILMGLIILAAKLPALHILPIFFGFLSYKIALLIHLLQTIFRPSRPRRS